MAMSRVRRTHECAPAAYSHACASHPAEPRTVRAHDILCTHDLGARVAVEVLQHHLKADSTPVRTTTTTRHLDGVRLRIRELARIVRDLERRRDNRPGDVHGILAERIQKNGLDRALVQRDLQRVT